MKNQTLAQSVETFIKASPWLDSTHAPAVAQLRILAAEMDKEPTPAGLNAFGLAYRNLQKAAPTAPTEDGDELDSLIPDS